MKYTTVVIIIAVNKVCIRVVCHSVTCLCLPVDEGLISAIQVATCICYPVASSSVETASRRFVFAGIFSDLSVTNTSSQAK